MPADLPDADGENDREDESQGKRSNRKEQTSDDKIARPSTHDANEERISDVTLLLQEMRVLGLEPKALQKFTLTLHKLAVASGVSPKILTAIISEVNELCDGRKISIREAREYIERLSDEQKALQKAVRDLGKKKQSLEAELTQKELEYSAMAGTLPEFVRVKQHLQEHDLSFDDLTKLTALIKNAQQMGYNSSVIIETLSDLKFKERKRREIDTEIENLLNSKRTLQNRLVALEQEKSGLEQMLKSAEELKKLGFDTKELDALYAAIRMISQTRNIELSEARKQLLSDLEHYYASDQELKKRIRILESLVREKEENFSKLETDYQNEKAVLDSARRLVSSGLDEQWLGKLRILIDYYGIDLDSLSQELKEYKSLKAGIEELQRTKRALEQEEQLLRQKVVAVEDQRLRTLSLINDMIRKVPRSISSSPFQESTGATSDIQQQQKSPKEVDTVSETRELGELIRAANGKDLDVEKFSIYAQKAIEIICSKLQKNSPARVVLEQALLALRHEANKRRQRNKQNSL